MEVDCLRVWVDNLLDVCFGAHPFSLEGQLFVPQTGATRIADLEILCFCKFHTRVLGFYSVFGFLYWEGTVSYRLYY